MAIAFDAQSAPPGNGGAGDLSWTHTPVGTPRGVLVVAGQVMGTSSVIDAGGITYGGQALSPVRAALLKSTGEAMGVHAWFLGSGIPTGAQTVNIDVVGTNNLFARCYSFTADADTEVIDFDVVSSDSVANPSVTLQLGGRLGAVVLILESGQDAVGGVTPLTGWTGDVEIDGGAFVAAIYHYNTVDTADVSAGWTQAAEDAVAIAVALGEVVAAPSGFKSAWARGSNVILKAA